MEPSADLVRPGDVQSWAGAASSEHLNSPPSFERNANDPETFLRLLLMIAFGCLAISEVGATVSTANSRVAGEVSASPTASVANPEKVCAPSLRVGAVKVPSSQAVVFPSSSARCGSFPASRGAVERELRCRVIRQSIRSGVDLGLGWRVIVQVREVVPPVLPEDRLARRRTSKLR